MAKPHFLIRRSRSGRINFTLLAGQGRITGVVTVPTDGRSRPEIEAEARERIRALADVLAQVSGSDGEAAREADPEACQTLHDTYN